MVNSCRGRLTCEIAKTMDAEEDRQRGLELGRRWAEHASAHELATMVSGSFDDLSQICRRMYPIISSAASAKAYCASGAEPRPSTRAPGWGPSALAPPSLADPGVSSKGLLGTLDYRTNR